MPFRVRSVIQLVLAGYDGFAVKDYGLPIFWSPYEINHTVLNICLFPPLFFFYGLYYTDVASTATVLMTFHDYRKQQTFVMIISGLFSLLFRQTNIFWVSIYIGGSHIASCARKIALDQDYPLKATFTEVLISSWQTECVYDPLVKEAYFEGVYPPSPKWILPKMCIDYLKSALSLAVVIIRRPRWSFRCLWPYFSILAFFVAFVILNGGVVLGSEKLPLLIKVPR